MSLVVERIAKAMSQLGIPHMDVWREFDPPPPRQLDRKREKPVQPRELPPIAREAKQLELISHELLERHGVTNVCRWIQDERLRALKSRGTVSEIVQATPRFIVALPSSSDVAARMRMEPHLSALQKAGAFVAEDGQDAYERLLSMLTNEEQEPRDEATGARLQQPREPLLVPERRPLDDNLRALLLQYMNRQNGAVSEFEMEDVDFD